MIVVALPVFALVMAVTAWLVRPASSRAVDGDATDRVRHAREWAAAQIDHVAGQLRSTTDRLRARTNDIRRRRAGNGAAAANGAPIVVPVPGSDRGSDRPTTDAHLSDGHLSDGHLSDGHLEGFDLRSVARFATRFFGCV